MLNRLVKFTYNYHVGDIVTLKCVHAPTYTNNSSPNDPQSLITKRILALSGDTVQLWVPSGSDISPESIHEGAKAVRSLAYTDLYHRALRAVATSSEDHERGSWLTITVPRNHAWVEGDASAMVPSKAAAIRPENKSRDSREYGPVPLGLITARVEYVLWPFCRLGTPPNRPSQAQA